MISTSNCSIAAGSATTITAYNSATLTVQADTANYYELPQSIGCENVSLRSYNASTGTIVIENPYGSRQGTVALTITAVPMTFSIAATITNG